MDLKAWKFHQNSFPPFSSLSPYLCWFSPSKIPIYSQKMVSTVLGWHGQNSVYSGCLNFSKGQWVNYHWLQRPWLGPHVHLGTNHNILIGQEWVIPFFGMDWKQMTCSSKKHQRNLTKQFFFNFDTRNFEVHYPRLIVLLYTDQTMVSAKTLGY